MSTQRGMETQLATFERLADQYWAVRRQAEAAWRRVEGALHEHKISTGDLMLDYCLIHYGLYYKGMAERYRSVNKVLAGHTGELVVAEWNEKLQDGFLRHFKLGILTADEIQFPHKLNCIMPVSGYVTHKDVAEDGKLHPGGFHEHFEFFVPAEIYGDMGSLMAYGSLLDNAAHELYRTQPNHHMASVIVGDDNVRKWFRNWRSVPNGEAVLQRLEDRLRSPRQSAVAIAA